MLEARLRVLKSAILCRESAKEKLRKLQKSGTQTQILEAKNSVDFYQKRIDSILYDIPFAKDLMCVRTCENCEYCTSIIDEKTKELTSRKCRIRKKGYDDVDINSYCDYHAVMKPNICWDCAHCFECEWSHGDPVPGWEAYPSAIVTDGVQSYHVVKCPEFEPEEHPYRYRKDKRDECKECTDDD